MLIFNAVMAGNAIRLAHEGNNWYLAFVVLLFVGMIAQQIMHDSEVDSVRESLKKARGW